MKHTTVVIGFVALLIMAVLVMPVMATPPCTLGSAGCPEHNVIDNLQPADIDITVPVTVQPPVNNFDPTIDVTVQPPVNNVDVDNFFNPEVDVDNHITVLPAPVVNKNTNINTNFNLNINDNDNTNINTLDQDQSQKQNQNQIQVQLQHQEQDQKQQQKQTQTQVMVLPQDANGLLISDTKSSNAPSTAQLDVGEVQVYSRLVYPGEVLIYPLNGGNNIFMRSATDVGLYTIGDNSQDIYYLNSIESTPIYDPIYHKMVFGTITPQDKVNFWTTKASLAASAGATNVVIDNRAPHNGYTHIELTITVSTTTPAEIIPEPLKVVAQPDVYPTDENGRAITS